MLQRPKGFTTTIVGKHPGNTEHEVEAMPMDANKDGQAEMG